MKILVDINEKTLKQLVTTTSSFVEEDVDETTKAIQKLNSKEGPIPLNLKDLGLRGTQLEIGLVMAAIMQMDKDELFSYHP